MTRSHRRATGARRLTVVAIASGGLLGLGATGVSAAAPPYPSETSYQWLRAGCFEGGATGWVAIGTIRTRVVTVRDPDKTYHQKVQISIDKLLATQAWRSIEKRTYDWSRFGRTAVPTYSTSAVRSALGPTLASGGYMSVRATVTLKRVRPGPIPDATVWRYERRSPTFTCATGATPPPTIPGGRGPVG